MDYSHLRFRAVVDWIEIEIETAASTNFQTVQRVLKVVLGMPDGRRPYVTARDEEPGGAARKFIFRLYDPDSWSYVVAKLDELAQRFPFASPSKVIAVEVAFDAYSRAEKADELAEQAARFYKFCTLVVSQNHRAYWDFKGSAKDVPFRGKSLVRHLSDGWQIGIGNKTDDRYQHIYVKTTDENGTALPRAEHRARIEITLRGGALPYQHADEWAKADFAKDLRMSAGFRMMRPNLDQLQRTMLEESTIQIGERKRRWRVAKDRSGLSGDRLHRKSTIADSILNGKARDSFRELTRRWR
jgi:hypothetical protein